MASKTVEIKSEQEPIVIENTYSYSDNGLWLQNVSQKINDETPVIIEAYTYNTLGQTSQKKIASTDNGTSYLQTVDYTYNAKGALTSINNINDTRVDLFAMELSYENNGNIKTQKWATQSVSSFKTNTYNYDKLNRLTSVSTDNRYFNETFKYDLNGNILTSTRRGQKVTKTSSGTTYSYATVDNLTYTYSGKNQVQVVNDAVSSVNTTLNNDFRDNGAYLRTEYTYDANGNMLTDANKNLTVTYNNLDLASSISVYGKGTMNYTYTAAGTKLSSVFSDGINQAKTTEYCGSFVYENDVLSYILTSYGRILYTEGRFSREYNLTDHLGNVRVVFDENGVAKQEMHYYAFGLQQSGVGFDNSTNEYFYNGKELQEEAGINYLNYGWRQLDPQLGIWHSVDKLAEMYPNQSPYSYAGNNPINNVDLYGLQKYSMFDPIIYSTFGKESYKRGGGGISPGTTIDRIVDEYDALAENDAIPDGMSVSDYIDVKTSKTYYVYDNTTNTLYLNENLLSGYYTSVDGFLQQLSLTDVGTFQFHGSVRVNTFDGLLKRIGADAFNSGINGDYAPKLAQEW